jgi:hypothetical protein
VCLTERVGEEVRHEHVIRIELRLWRGGRRYGRWRGWEMKALLSDLRFIRRSLVKGH